MDFQTLLTELKEKYTQVRKLLDSNDKCVDETKPYKSKYEAIDILKDMHSSLLKTPNNIVKEENDVNTLLAIISLNLGIVYVETEELKLGEECFMNCIDNLNENETLPQRIIPMISALNQLGILWSQRNQASVSKTFLERAENIYKDFMKLGNKPINMSSLFLVKIDDEPEPITVLEKLHTLTLYYLAQIYGTLEDYLKSAIYCHMTLCRQLEYKDYESIDWALNAATLSQFFLEKECFSQARHYLSAATYVLQNYQSTLTAIEADVENEESAAKIENFKHRSADIDRCWVKYGILLLSASKERLLLKSENEDNAEQENTYEIDKTCLENLIFTSIKKDIEILTKEITDKYLLDFSDAKLVFFKINEWIDNAKKYYCLENHASDYVQLIQDQSQAYKYLSFFLNEEAQQAKMHKRRIDMLEDVLKELHETYYQNCCRQIWMELGETYSEILDIKLERLQTMDERPTPNMLKKINNLTSSAIKYFEKFIESVKKSMAENNKFPDELTRPVLSAYFHLGRLYNKFITPEKNQQLENVEKSYSAYSFLVNYCERDSNAKELMQIELSICKDFVNLLPLKISKLRLEINN